MSLRPVVPLLPPEVQTAAACRGQTEIFFPAGDGTRFLGSNVPQDYSAARSICVACPVRTECLEHAVSVGEPAGMWGGATPEERKRIRAARKAAATGGEAHAL